MCGIFLYIGKPTFVDVLCKMFFKTKHRGPDDSQYIVLYINEHTMLFMGFHRLSINNVHQSGNQPMLLENTLTMCNGEIYNHKDLQKNHTGSDCFVIPTMYRQLQGNMKDVCNKLDGVFSFVLYDRISNTIHVARDRIGIRSLYYTVKPGEYTMITSELKNMYPNDIAVQFPPGHYATINIPTYSTITFTPFWTIPSRQHSPLNQEKLRDILINAVKKRIDTSEQEIGCILSGGLDSSLITSIVCRLQQPKKVHTYTIGLKGSDDLKYARIVANYLNTEHHEYIVTEDEMLAAVPDVIEQIESYDVTTVRASVPNWLLGKYIRRDGKTPVIMCGDVSDELFAGYRGFGYAKNAMELNHALESMLKNIHHFDVLRCEKSFTGHGLECRVPFGDRDLINYICTIDSGSLLWNGKDKIEKHILRSAFVGYLPPEVLWRRKEAFSDGVSRHERSWFSILKEHVCHMDTTINSNTQQHMIPYDSESSWYRTLFKNCYPMSETCVPYYWKQPCTHMTDPSARTLSNY